MGKLFVVATPIGNLGDITLRALKILKQVDLIACEDTRRTKILLRHYAIDKPLISYHEHSKLKKIEYLIDQLKKGKVIALVSDAGTPAMADPGGVLIKTAYEAKIEIEAIPGPSSLSAILSVAGLNVGKFLFLGFLPKKKGRQTVLKEIAESQIPVVFFESPYRIKKTLTDLAAFTHQKQVIIGRELTKKFGEILRGKPKELLAKVKELGEFVLIVNNE